MSKLGRRWAQIRASNIEVRGTNVTCGGESSSGSRSGLQQGVTTASPFMYAFLTASEDPDGFWCRVTKFDSYTCLEAFGLPRGLAAVVGDVELVAKALDTVDTHLTAVGARQGTAAAASDG